MIRSAYFFPRVQAVLVAVFLACFFSTALCVPQGLPDERLLRYEPPSRSEAQKTAEQLRYIEHCAEVESHRAHNVNIVLMVLCGFGAFAALWARYTLRSTFLWFLIGFTLNFGAVFLILWLSSGKRKKPVRRYRAVMDFWTLEDIRK